MGEINKVLGASGTGLTVMQGEKVWTLSRLTKKIQGKFEEWMEGRARRHVAAFASVVSPEAFSEMVERLGVRIEDGEYSFTGPKCQEAYCSPSGATEIIRLLLQPNHHDVTAEDAINLMADCSAELSVALRQMRGKAPEADDSKKNGTVNDSPSPTLPTVS